VRVTTRSSMNRVVLEEGADGEVTYKVYVTVVPEDGKANKAVIKLLAKHLGVAKSDLRLIRGETCRDKVFQIGS